MNYKYKCMDCKKEIVTKKCKDGLNCDECKGPLTPLGETDDEVTVRKPLKLSVSITGLDLFSNILAVIKDILQDETIDCQIRLKYYKQIHKAVLQSKSGEEILDSVTELQEYFNK